MKQSRDVYSVLKYAVQLLTDSGLSDAKASAETLLSFVLNTSRSKLPLIRNQKLSEKEISVFNDYILRRSKREPAAYITGFCGFMGYEFSVNKNVLIPRPETELLVEEVLKLKYSYSCHSGLDPESIVSKNNSLFLKFLKNANVDSRFCGNDGKVVLDLCTGSGCIAVSLAKSGLFEKITAADISDKALETAVKNADLNGVKNIEFIKSDVFENLAGRKFDIIVSNPPYISQEERERLEPELGFEPVIALIAPNDGLFFYRKIAEQAKLYLNQGGIILLELNANKSAEIKKIFQDAGFEDVKIIKDYSDLDRILKIRT